MNKIKFYGCPIFSYELFLIFTVWCICRLAGIIAYDARHYTAVCRRNTGQWELFNDLAPKSTAFRSKQQLTPHAVIYTRISK